MAIYTAWEMERINSEYEPKLDLKLRDILAAINWSQCFLPIHCSFVMRSILKTNMKVRFLHRFLKDGAKNLRRTIGSSTF